MSLRIDSYYNKGSRGPQGTGRGDSGGLSWTSRDTLALGPGARGRRMALAGGRGRSDGALAWSAWAVALPRVPRPRLGRRYSGAGGWPIAVALVVLGLVVVVPLAAVWGLLRLPAGCVGGGSGAELSVSGRWRLVVLGWAVVQHGRCAVTWAGGVRAPGAGGRCWAVLGLACRTYGRRRGGAGRVMGRGGAVRRVCCVCPRVLGGRRSWEAVGVRGSWASGAGFGVCRDGWWGRSPGPRSGALPVARPQRRGVGAACVWAGGVGCGCVAPVVAGGTRAPRVGRWQWRRVVRGLAVAVQHGRGGR
jgi:hypothetical protein